MFYSPPNLLVSGLKNRTYCLVFRGKEKKTQKQIYESIMDKLLLIWIITSSATIGSYAFNKKKMNKIE